jgi:hypothetical protein
MVASSFFTASIVFSILLLANESTSSIITHL